MKILDDLISSLDVEAPVRDIRVGMFHTGVLTRYCGLAASLPKDVLRQEPPFVKTPGSLIQKGASDLIRLAYSDSLLEAAIGMATINSLFDVDENSCEELNASELIMEKGSGKRIAIVGHFPFQNKVKSLAKKLWVIEKNPRKDDYNEQDAEGLIPQADVVAITGTSITNHTIEHLLRLCDTKAFVIMLGDTTPLSPTLFDHGVNALSGTRVIDHEKAFRCLSEGANFRQFKGIKKLTMLRK